MPSKSPLSLRPTLLSGFLALLLFASCSTKPEPIPMDLSAAPLIPLPTRIEATGSSFVFTPATDLFLADGADSLRGPAQFLADLLNPASSMEVSVQESNPAGNATVVFRLSERDLGPEGYLLEITEDRITISASAPAGAFYAVQTLRQLLPASLEMDSPGEGPWRVATGLIEDKPVFGYRGAMLDVARHFFSVEDVKRFTDLIAMYKMNRLHLHLTDDQGWRIEIKSWPKLTEVGGSTQVGGGEGGFYTQEEYADIVAYAQDRFVTIVPEIDMPGHTNAALVSYPELYCTGKAPELYTGTEVGFSTLCTSNERTYEFIDDVIGELAALTPGEYLHIGGDESHVTPLEDYIPFIERVQEIVRSHGKKVIGWDEIAHAKLLPNTVVQWWAEPENAKMGIEQGAKVLVSPANKAYLDMQYDSTSRLGLHWAGYIEVDTGYSWDPATVVEGIGAEHIIGIEAPLWSETIATMDDIEYLLFPRLPGYAEIGWTAAADRDWEEYRERLGLQKPRFEALGIDYYVSPVVPWRDSLPMAAPVLD